MQCPDCKQLRHVGECEPRPEDPSKIELLRMDMLFATERYLKELERLKARNEPI